MYNSLMYQSPQNIRASVIWQVKSFNFSTNFLSTFSWYLAASILLAKCLLLHKNNRKDTFRKVTPTSKPNHIRSECLIYSIFCNIKLQIILDITVFGSFKLDAQKSEPTLWAIEKIAFYLILIANFCVWRIIMSTTCIYYPPPVYNI